MSPELNKEQKQTKMPAPRWIWRSRRGTTDAGIFSVLAAIEVLFAVAGYWWFAIWSHSQVHLLVGALIAPLLLLRSTESVALGVKWFSHFDIDFGVFSWTSRVINKSIGWIDWFFDRVRGRLNDFTVSRFPTTLISLFFYGGGTILVIVTVGVIIFSIF